jgi:mannose-1-phosphate guanylyltransferase/mannose-6-phosphate isomerase
MELIPVIMSGGSGTRLWPLSRASFPKQFVDLFEGSLLARTLLRLKRFGTPWTITVSGMKVLTTKTYQDLSLDTSQIIFEPQGKNTAPAIALICQMLAMKNHSEKIVGLFPADHLIENEDAFYASIELAVQCAERGQIVTLGIQPSSPSTGFGYIEVTDSQFAERGEQKAYSTKGFHEKPTRAKAEAFIQNGHYYWNAGIFIFRVREMIEAFQNHMPELWAQITLLKADLTNLDSIYEGVKSQSIDYGIMEKVTDQVCVPCDLGWSDVGSWDEVSRLRASSPAPIEEHAKQNWVAGQSEKVYSFVGVEDLIVVDTADALLIARRGETQRVKELLSRVSKEGHVAATTHVFEHRPWGHFEILKDTPLFKSKIIRVEAGQKISYQSHKRRAEHWVIVKGAPDVVLDDVVHHLKVGDAIFIPRGAKHRIANPGTGSVEFVEVQIGDYFGEDDITRYSDDYGRT